MSADHWSSHELTVPNVFQRMEESERRLVSLTHSLTDCRKESFAFVLERHCEKTAPQVNTSTFIHPHFDYLTFRYDLLEKENTSERNI